MITDITVRNLRSFSEQKFRVAPITILLGQNSAGKSSVTRLFPLFKQSSEQVASAPILWNSSYVDYGSFQEVLSRSAEEPELSFSFDISTERFLSQLAGPRDLRPTRDPSPKLFSYDLFLGAASKGRTKTLESIIRVDDDVVRINYDRRGRVASLEVNDWIPADFTAKAKAEGFQRGLAPLVQMTGIPQSNMSADASKAASVIADLLASSLKKSDSIRSLSPLGRTLMYRPKSYFKDYLISNIRTNCGIDISPHRLRRDVVEKLRSYLLMRDMNRLTRMVSSHISADVEASQYIGPIRARAERYYRIQELAIDHIDPNGENVAMYLNFLPPGQLKKFNTIFLQAFGYTVEPSQSRGHVSLLLREGGVGRGDNIADVGFGFSQVIPVVAQIFAATSHRDSMSVGAWRSSPIVAVEQPELHLHPAFQAKLADLFAQLSKPDNPVGRRSRFVVETHSEAFVNRLGRLIAQGDVDPADVVIYTFEKVRGSGLTRVGNLTFGSDGLIADWPVGFFSAR